VVDTRYFSPDQHEFILYPVDLELARYPHEKLLVQRIFGTYRETEQNLSDLRRTFYTAVPFLKEDLYQQLVKLGLFPASPHETRKRWLWLAIGGLAISLVGAVMLYSWFGHLSAAVVWPPLGLVPGLAVLAIISRHMPQKTATGAEEAAKWLAFKNYLENLEADGELEIVKDKFQKYFPYAIAFGLEKRMIHRFSKVDAPAPSWWGPVLVPDVAKALPDAAEVLADGLPSMPAPVGSTAVPVPRLPGRIGGGGKGGVPSLTGMSEGLGSSLASVSRNLGGLLNSTASVLVKPPPPPPPPSPTPSFASSANSMDGLEIAGKIALLALEIGLAAAGGGGGGGGGSRGFG
jgi:hypothetical protein